MVDAGNDIIRQGIDRCYKERFRLVKPSSMWIILQQTLQEVEEGA